MEGEGAGGEGWRKAWCTCSTGSILLFLQSFEHGRVKLVGPDGPHLVGHTHARGPASHTPISHPCLTLSPLVVTLTVVTLFTQMLDRDLEEAEEQYGLAVRAHMMVMDSLLDLQYARMRALEAEFAAQLKALEDEFEA